MRDNEQNETAADFRALLAFLENTPNEIASLTSDLSDAEFCWRNSTDEFLAVENICHLRDLELQGYTPRVKRILAEINPVLADFDGARVAAESNYNSEHPNVALQSFELARKENVKTFRSLTDEQLKREGVLEGVGLITLLRLAEMMREHD
jgi:hypothetical protein